MCCPRRGKWGCPYAVQPCLQFCFDCGQRWYQSTILEAHQHRQLRQKLVWLQQAMALLE